MVEDDIKHSEIMEDQESVEIKESEVKDHMKPKMVELKDMLKVKSSKLRFPTLDSIGDDNHKACKTTRQRSAKKI